MYLYAKIFDFCQVDRRAAVVERLNELKVSAKRRRTGRLGGGSRADMELRRAVALLGARLSETTARRSRIRADEVPADGSSNHSGGILSMVTAGDGGGKKSPRSNLCLGLLGDTAFMPPAEGPLAAALAAAVGGALRLRAVVLCKVRDVGDAQHILAEDSNLEYNDGAALAFLPLDNLSCDSMLLQCLNAPFDEKYNDAEKVTNDNDDDNDDNDEDSGDGASNAVVGPEGDKVETFDTDLAEEADREGEPLLALPLPPLGLTNRELQQRFGWQGYAVNHLLFAPHQARGGGPGAPGVPEDPLSLRRCLWLPLCGRTMVLNDIDGALRFRQVCPSSNCSFRGL